MDLAAVFILEILYSIALLVLISAGLAVVFGMMRVINLAHGEFMMMGGYATIVAVQAGVNVYVAMLIVAPLAVGLIGLDDRIVIEGKPGPWDVRTIVKSSGCTCVGRQDPDQPQSNGEENA